jgi:hypothetical protein
MRLLTTLLVAASLSDEKEITKSPARKITKKIAANVLICLLTSSHAP